MTAVRKEFQLDLLNGLSDFNDWIDARITKPEDGQIIVKYYVINNPENESEFVKTIIKSYDGLALMGPIVTEYVKDKEDDGSQAVTAFWKPLALLPAEKWQKLWKKAEGEM